MNIDLEYASKLTQRVVSIDGVAHLQTMLDADVVDDVSLGVNALQVPIEIDDVMQEARMRACRTAHGVLGIHCTIDPVTGVVGILVGGKELGAKLGAASITYDSQGRVSTHDGWTMTYDASGRVARQTKGAQTQTFNYNAAGLYTGITES